MIQLDGIHHVSATTADAACSVDFYARLLGLRLAKKTVSQDEPTVYHLLFGDEAGSPGTACRVPWAVSESYVLSRTFTVPLSRIWFQDYSVTTSVWPS